jgi:hypothetical protein
MDSREGSSMMLSSSTVSDGEALFKELRRTHIANRQLVLRSKEDERTIAALEQQVKDERTNGSAVLALKAELAAAADREAEMKQQIAQLEERLADFGGLLQDRDARETEKEAEMDELRARIAAADEERKADLIARDRASRDIEERLARAAEIEAMLRLEQQHLGMWAKAAANSKRLLERDAIMRTDISPEEVLPARERCDGHLRSMRQSIDRELQATRGSNGGGAGDSPPPAQSASGNSGGTTPHSARAPLASSRARAASIRPGSHADPNAVGELMLPEAGSSLFAATLLDPLSDLMLQTATLAEKLNETTQRIVAPQSLKPTGTGPGGTDAPSAKNLSFWSGRK